MKLGLAISAMLMVGVSAPALAQPPMSVNAPPPSYTPVTYDAEGYAIDKLRVALTR